MQMMPTTPSDSIPPSPEALFAAIKAALIQNPQTPYVLLPGAAATMGSHYTTEHLQTLIDQVPAVLEHWVENNTEFQIEVDKQRVIERVHQGCTLICNNMQHRDPLSAQWSSQLHEALGQPGRHAARIFYTNAIEQAYGMHLDPFFTLTLQISGCKLWKIATHRAAIDIQRLTHSILAPAPGEYENTPYGTIVGPDAKTDAFVEVMLQPGDALLITPGLWHHVIPLSQSFSVAWDVVPLHQPDSEMEIALIQHSN